MDFFESVLPTKGLYCFATATYGKDSNKLSGLTHIKFDSIQEVRNEIEGIISKTAAKELYFSPSSFAKCSRTYNGFRTAKNAAWVKSLFIDVDIKPMPQFCQSVEEAVEELTKLCAITKWPSPWIVFSGHGLHLYWPLSCDVEATAWQALAEQFLTVVANHTPKLVADAARTRDRAALLRVPGSFNHKRGEAVKVEILAESEGTIEPESFAIDLDRRITLAADIRHKEVTPGDRVHLTAAVTTCNWLRTYIAEKETASEPEWYAAISLARFLYVDTSDEPLNKAAILLSKGHPGFSEAAVDKKLAQLEKQSIGPATCHRLGSMFPERCRTCPLRGVISSPIAGARKVAKTDPLDIQTLFTSVDTEVVGNEESQDMIEVGGFSVLKPPAPFFFNSGGIYTSVGENIKRIFDFYVLPINRAKDEYTGQEIVEILAAFPKDEPRVIRMPMSLTADDKRMGVFLADYGIIPDRSTAAHFYKYIVAYVRALQNMRPATRQYSQLGWRFPDPNDIRQCEFVLGDVVYTRNRWVANTSVSPSLAPSKAAATAAGSLDAWRKAFGVLKDVDGAEPLIVGALMGFAAPLIEFTPYNGVLVNLYGGSGRGKSTAQRFATSIWGVPNERMILTQDNRIPMLNRLGAMRNLPVTFDELTEMEPEALGTLLYEISGGRGKERANIQGVTRANETTWKTVVLGSSNTSIYSKVARLRTGNNGQAYRVLEFEVGPASPSSAVLIDSAKSALDSNYGHAGRLYAEHICDNVLVVRNLVNDEIPKLMVQLEAQPAERFWVAAIAAFKVGASIAKTLGLHNYNVDGLVRWLFKATKAARIGVSESYGNAVDTFGNFLLEHINSSIRDDGKSMIVLPPNVRSINVRYYGDGTKVHEVVVAKKAIVDYCRQARIEYGWLMSGLKASGCMLGVRKVNLMDRTGMPAIEVDCYVFDMQSLSDMSFHTPEAGKISQASVVSSFIN